MQKPLGQYIEVSKLSLEEALRASERFPMHSDKTQVYDVSLESHDPRITITRVAPGRGWITGFPGSRIAIGHIALRVHTSPFLLWRDEKRGKAQTQYSSLKQGVILDCTSGVRELTGGTAIASACVPRKFNDKNATHAAIEELLTNFHR